jgi:hypothetical protein
MNLRKSQPGPHFKPSPLIFAESVYLPFITLVDSPFQFSPMSDSIAEFREKMFRSWLSFLCGLQAHRKRDKQQCHEHAHTGSFTRVSSDIPVTTYKCLITQ